MLRKILINLSLFSALLLCSFGAQAQGMVREFFACNFTNDANMDDLMEARDYMLEHLEMGGIDPATAFLWTPLKTNNEVDFLWFNQYESLNAFGAEQDDYLTNVHGQMVQNRFDGINECVSGIVTHQPLYTGGEFNPGDQSVIVNSSACQLKEGKSMAQVTDVIGSFTDMIEDLGSHDKSNGFMQTPLISSSGMDVYFFTVFGNLADWSAAESAMGAAPQAQAIGAAFNDLVSCNTSLWQAQVIVQAP